MAVSSLVDTTSDERNVFVPDRNGFDILRSNITTPDGQQQQQLRRLQNTFVDVAVITTYAGNGVPGVSGDGGPATNASLGYSYAVAVDISGNVFTADGAIVRVVDKSTGIITRYAGGGSGGDGGPATSASLYPVAIATDTSGNLFIVDYGNAKIRSVTKSTGIITTFAGSGVLGCSCDRVGPATDIPLYFPHGVAVDISGNVFIADTLNNRIRVVTTSTGIMRTFAGTGTNIGLQEGTFSGDGGPATSAGLVNPSGVAVDISGNVFIADTCSNRIRVVTKSTGIITTYAGNGGRLEGITFSGDGGPATSASIVPNGLAVDISGNVFISDSTNGRIRVATKSACSAGSYVSGSTCASCAAGTYSSLASFFFAPTACLTCPVGSYSSAAATACTSCAAGSYAPLSSSSTCTPCPAGYYAASTGASVCSACPANTYNAVTGSVSLNACTACGGFSNPGSSVCYQFVPTKAPVVRSVVPLAVVRFKQTITGLDLATVSSLPFQNRFFAIQSLITNLPISAFLDFTATAGRRRSLLQSPVTVAYTVSAPNSDPAALSALLSAPAATALLQSQLKATYASIAVLAPTFTNQSPTPAPTAVAALAPTVVVLRATQSISG